jgi:Xaa-Pro aminopeptidase
MAGHWRVMGMPRVHPQSSDILEAGMTFNIEPAIYLDGVGRMRHCDVVACTHNGAEVFTGILARKGSPANE